MLNKKAYKYVEADGTLTNNEARAELVRAKDENGNYVKINDDGSMTIVNNEADASLVPKKNADYDTTGANDGLLYMKADGKTATASYTEAAHDPNFNITVSELTDRNGRVLYTIGKPTRTEITEADFIASGGKATATVNPADDVVTITTYIKELSDEIIRNPLWNKGSTTAYPYLTASGTGTNDPQQAAKVYQYNPNFGKSPNDDDWDPNAPQDGNSRYIKVDQTTMQPTNQGTNDYNEAWIPKANNAYDANDTTGYRYIKYASKDKDPATLTAADYTNDLDEARGAPTYYKEVYEKVPSSKVKLDDNDLY